MNKFYNYELSTDEEKLNEPGEPEEDLHVSTTSDHAGEYLEECEANTGFPVTSDATPEPNKEESSPDETSEPADQVLKKYLFYMVQSNLS